MNRKLFFDSIRKSLFGGAITVPQVAGITAILDYYQARKYTDTQALAYILATAYHETARTMQPVEEFGRGKGRDYGKMLKMGKGPGRRIPYLFPKQLYYGRGHVQLTWYENYEFFGKLLGLPLLTNPALALEMSTSVRILVEGSLGGHFTGKKLGDYFAGPKEDPRNARRVINGLDCADAIVGYYRLFLAAIHPSL